MSLRKRSHPEALPDYNTALGVTETLAVTPPFSFNGVTARVFPLRAHMNSLRRFCDRYLNVANEVCDFRPYLPYVFLVVLDYGRMAIEEFNLGWVSQNEIFFGVPLAKWGRDRLGRPIFEKWVMNTPFIIVDDARSLTGGRESYGWPKILGTLHSSPERWLIDPRNPTRFLRVDIRGADSEESSIRLLDIEQKSGQNASLVPPDLGMMDPFGWLSRLTRTSMQTGYSLAQIALAAPLFGFASATRGQRRGGRRTVLLDSLLKLPDFLNEPGLDVVTLKQFRDAQDPTQICYQALVESRLGVTRYNRGGLLGAYNMLQGDITGGFRIRLHDNPAFPVIESFGLEVAEQQTFRTSAVRRQTISHLEPFLPFWLSVDLDYGKGNTICSRTKRKGWQVKDRQVSPPRKKMYFNTIAGAAEHVWHGPFYLPDATFDIYFLKAHPDRYEDLLTGYLDAGGRGYLSRGNLDPYVLMIVSANRMFSKARSGASIKAAQVTFNALLGLDLPNHSRAVMVTPFAFVDNPVLATTLREVQGVPAVDASIETPSQFLQSGKEPLLNMQVDVFEAIGAGMPSQQRTLLEILPDNRKTKKTKTNIGGYGEIVSLGSLDRLMLKQFRDAENPYRACYQSLILEPWTFQNPDGNPDPISLPEFESIETPMLVHVYRYPSLPLVETLGLVVRETLPPRKAEGAVADVLEVVKACRWRVNVKIGVGRELSEVTSDELTAVR